MARIRWTPQSVDDLEAITEYIAVDSPAYATLFVLDIVSAIDRLQSFPGMGRVVPETNDESIREIIFRNYRIVYRLKSDLTEILTIYHGSRLLDPSALN
jgi:toxin ParE1/3/4